MGFKESVPVLLRRFLPRELLSANILEAKATCSACAMDPRKTRTKIHYNPHLKCCTFYPFQTNFSVGAILDEDGEGASRVRQLIEKRVYTLPLGIVAPPDYQFNFNNKSERDFGNREDFLCPYFNQENEDCSIWQNRGSVCTSFICKSSYGKAGLNFWQALGDYLHFIEMALVEEILVHLDFSPRQISDQLELVKMKDPKSGIRRLPQGEYKKLWNFYEDETEFYIKCFQMAVKLNRKDLLRAVGSQGEQMEDFILQKLEKLEA